MQALPFPLVVAMLLIAAGPALHASQVSDAIAAGNAAWASNDLDSAIASFSEAIRLDPSDPATYYYRGRVYVQKGDATRAIGDFDTSIRYNPKSADAFLGRGVAYGLAENCQQAIADFNEAIRLGARDAYAFWVRGAAYAQMGDHAHALADLNHAIELDPGFDHAFISRSIIYEVTGDYQRATDDAQFAVHLTTNSNTDFAALNQLAWILATSPIKDFRNGSKAVDLATKACERTQWKRAAEIDTLAAAYAETGNFPEAIRWEKRCLELLPSGKKAKECNDRLNLYQAKKPYREQPKSM